MIDRGQVLYMKRGRRYHPVVAEYDRHWPVGTHMIQAEADGTLRISYNIPADQVGVRAVLTKPSLTQHLIQFLAELVEGEVEPDTDTQRKAMAAYYAAGGVTSGSLRSRSAHEILNRLAAWVSAQPKDAP